jgi:hypothetical protein
VIAVPPIMYSAYGHFNRVLFGGRLKYQRMVVDDLGDGVIARASTWMTPMRFNSSNFEGGTRKDMAVMVHEMAHTSVGNGHGHDNTWIMEMDRIGFNADSGGYDYPRPGGAFDLAFQDFQRGSAAGPMVCTTSGRLLACLRGIEGAVRSIRASDYTRGVNR